VLFVAAELVLAGSLGGRLGFALGGGMMAAGCLDGSAGELLAGSEGDCRAEELASIAGDPLPLAPSLFPGGFGK
jgi:hypothetical protein